MIPVVSVVIPAYNRDRFIGEAIESVLAQETDFPFEVIVSDDGSTDRTVEIACDFGDRVRVLTADRNRGAAAARNAGIRAAQAPIVALLDSDDRMLPGRLQRQTGFMRAHPEVGVVTAACEQEHGESARQYFYKRGIDVPWGEWRTLPDARAALVRGFLGNQSTTTIRRALVEQVGFYRTDLVTLEDWDLMFRLAGKTQFAVLNLPVAWIRTSHDGRLGHSSQGSIQAPEVWDALLHTIANLSSEERALLERRRAGAVRGALAAAYAEYGRSGVREILARYGETVDPRTRMKWSAASMVPAWLAPWLLRAAARKRR